MPLDSAIVCKRLGANSSGDVVVGAVRLGAARAPRQFLEGVNPSCFSGCFQSQEAWAAASGLRRSEKTPGRTPTRVETFLETGKITGPATRLAAHVLRRDSCSMAMCPKHTAVFCRLVVVAPEKLTLSGVGATGSTAIGVE